MIIIGLTGSIGSGKSFAASFFRSKKIPIYNADHEVDKILKNNFSVEKKIKRIFPTVFKNKKINRNTLAEIVFNNKKKLIKLEKIIHPIVGGKKKEFINYHKEKKSPVIVLEIPILFETGGNKKCNYTILMLVNKKVQEKRVLKRKNMTKDKFDRIIRNQMPEKRKRQLADFIVNNSQTKKKTRQKLESIIKKILSTVL